MVACYLTGTPFVPTVHNVISVHRRNIRTSRFLGTVAQDLAPLIHRVADAVGVVSEAVLRDIAYSVERPDKFHVLYNPVDTEHFSPRKVPGEDAFTTLPNDDGNPVVLASGASIAPRISRLSSRQSRNCPLRYGSSCSARDQSGAISGHWSGRSALPIAFTCRASWSIRPPGTGAPPFMRSQPVTRASATRSSRRLRPARPVVADKLHRSAADLLGHGRYGTIVPADDPAPWRRHSRRPSGTARSCAADRTRRRTFRLEACLNRYEAMLRP